MLQTIFIRKNTFPYRKLYSDFKRVYCIVFKILYQEGDERLVGWRDQTHHLLLQPIFFKDLHLFLEHIMIVQPKQAFVGVIDAKLLETVVIKVLEPEYIQNGDFLTLKH